MKQLFLLLSSLGIALTACTGAKKNAETAFQQEQCQSLSLGVMPTMDGLPFVIAQKQGIYDSLGLDVSLIRFNSANDRDAAFQSGQIEGAVTDYPSAVVMQSHHTGLGIIMKNNGYFCFIVSKESGINNQKQLKECNIAVSRNTVVEYATHQLLNKAGISATEVNKPEIGQIPLRMQMLQYGQIDACFLPDPFASIAMNSGHKSLISNQELDISFTCTIFSLKALKEKSIEIDLLIKGYNLGVEYLCTHPLNEWKQLLIEEIGVPETLTGLIVLPPYEPATRPSAKDIATTIAWLKTQGRIPDTYRGENLVDTTFITTTTTKQL